jgi:hypothetical protein
MRESIGDNHVQIAGLWLKRVLEGDSGGRENKFRLVIAIRALYLNARTSCKYLHKQRSQTKLDESINKSARKKNRVD